MTTILKVYKKEPNKINTFSILMIKMLIQFFTAMFKLELKLELEKLKLANHPVSMYLVYS